MRITKSLLQGLDIFVYQIYISNMRNDFDQIHILSEDDRPTSRAPAEQCGVQV